MGQLSTTVPDKLQRWVESRVEAEGFADAADYLLDLIQRDQDEYEEDVRRVQGLIDEGRASGIAEGRPEDLLREIVAEIRDENG